MVKIHMICWPRLPTCACENTYRIETKRIDWKITGGARMSKAMFLLAMWSLGTLCIFCGRWCEQQGALV